MKKTADSTVSDDGVKTLRPAESDRVIWTETMPDRRSGSERRAVNGRPINVADLREADARRDNDRRKTRLTITGRALEIGH